MTRALLLATWATGIWACWLTMAAIAARIREDDRRNVRLVYDPKTDSVRMALVYDGSVWNPGAAGAFFAPDGPAGG